MLRIALLFLAVSLASPLQAAVQVRSGEHNGFTRLVVYFDRGQTWDLKETEAGYQLFAEGLEEGFDIRRVYELIDRERVASLATSGDVLSLELGCACEARTSVLTTGHLIIDVQEVTVDDAVLTSEALPLPSSAPGPAALPAEGPDQRAPVALDLPTQNEPPEFATLPEPEEEASSVPEELTEFRRRLLENLGRSASLSLVTIEDAPDTDALSRQAEMFLGALGPERTQRAEVTTAVDDALRRAVVQLQPDELAQCPNPEIFDIAEWGGDTTFFEQISFLRRTLIGEFDAIDQRQVLSLAKAYLHYGLVAEAKHTLGQFDLPNAARDALVVLADLIDGDTASQTGAALGEYVHCDGPILPWLLLDAPKTAKLGDEQRSALVSEFANWPSGLQLFLGPRLISALQFRGHDTTASVLTDIMSGSKHDALEATPDEAAAPAEILANIDDGSEHSIDALARYFRQSMDAGSNIDLDQLELAAAFERETKGLPISERLRNLRFEAMAYRGDVNELMTEIERLETGIAGVDDDALSRIGKHVAGLADAKNTALFTVFLDRRDALNRLPNVTLEQLASRHLDMGLPLVAAQILDQAEGSAPPVELAVRLSEALGRVDEAVERLQALPTDEAPTRQADLLLKYARASQIPESDKAALPVELKDRVAWATADWENVRSDASQGAVSQLILDLQSADLSDAPLTTAKELQEMSQSTRALLAQLFDGAAD